MTIVLTLYSEKEMQVRHTQNTLVLLNVETLGKLIFE